MNDDWQTMMAQIGRAVLTKPSLAKLLALTRQWRVPVVYCAPRRRSGWAIAAWYRLASAVARWRDTDLLRLGDGFICSVSPDCKEPLLSIIADDRGDYQDACRVSRLETLITDSSLPVQQDRARELIALWRAHKVSRYNHCRAYHAALPLPYVLVVDQDLTDVSVKPGLADAACFQRMLAAALRENPDYHIVVFCPDTLTEKQRAYLDPTRLSNLPRVIVLTEALHPASLLAQAQAVYCVTSYIGFESLLWGKRVRTFGMPFYAGWGLTDDDLLPPARRKPVCLENLVYAALVAYSCYFDPETGAPCEPEQLIAWTGWQRVQRERFPPVVYALGFSHYKKPIVRRFFQGSQVLFDCPSDAIPPQATLALWGRQCVDALEKRVNSVRLEDGFIRSVGLGADLVQPLSWAMDTRGIYYDATRPSDLEHLLQETEFDKPLTDRARRLRERLVAEGLTKYNVGAANWRRPEAENTVILVPGQVESDASLAFGAPAIRKNLDLLKAVREANSEAYIVYKPHPDVVAGLRQPGQGEADVKRWCDEMVIDAGMADLLLQVDEVHTLTSLTGFEALLRGKKVVCYGLPFYAGWGLTNDVLTLERRTRKLTLDELVAGVLVLYPTYVSRITGKFTTPERALDELLAWRENSPQRLTWWRQSLRGLLKMEMLINGWFSKG